MIEGDFNILCDLSLAVPAPTYSDSNNCPDVTHLPLNRLFADSIPIQIT